MLSDARKTRQDRLSAWSARGFEPARGDLRACLTRPMSRRMALRVLVSTAGLAVVAACAPGAPGAVPTTAPAGVAFTATPVAPPRRGGTLRMGTVGDIPNLETHLLNQNAYDTLWQAFDRL